VENPGPVTERRFPVSSTSQLEDPAQVSSYTVTRVYRAGKIETDAEQFGLAFRLIEFASEMYSQGWLRQALGMAKSAEEQFDAHLRRTRRPDSSDLSSTEVKSIRHRYG
jgi:hypothetical protein